MKVLTPNYYRSFQCIASACPDSCCKEWEVDVDPETATFYRSLDGSLGDRLRQVLRDTDDGTTMAIENGRCPMWRQDGLCRIQAELGHNALCQVCRDFPRLRHDYGSFVELGLELSCPEAARLILSQDHEYIQEDFPGGEAPDYDEDIMSILLESRNTVRFFLHASDLPVNHKLAVLLLYAYEVQNWLDGGEPAELDIDNCLHSAQHHIATANWDIFLDFFRNLEVLTFQWKTRLSDPSAKMSWHSGYLSLIQYLIDRYWLQAISDYDLVCRVKLAICACLLICRLGGNFVNTAQLFSKEIENDLDNLEAILDGAYTSPALTDVYLLSLLLND